VKNSTNDFWKTRPSLGPHPTTGSLDSAPSTAGWDATVQRPFEVSDTRLGNIVVDSSERGVGEKGVVEFLLFKYARKRSDRSFSVVGRPHWEMATCG
jgi:hypothetical protein